MAQETLSGVIGDDLKFGPDYIFNETALENAGVSTSGAFQCGKVQGGIQLNVMADAEIVVAATFSITIDLYGSELKDGTYTKIKTLIVIPTGTQSAGEIIRHIPSDQAEVWGKIVITTTDDQSGDTVTAYITEVAK